MIKSMTAFARKQAHGDWGRASVEFKTVNHRYLDINLRLPEMLRELEMPIRDLLRKNVRRGKVDCSVRFTAGNAVATDVSVNEGLLQQVLQAANQVAEKMPRAADLDALEVLRWPGVMQIAEADLTNAQQQIIEITKAALTELNDVRQREGEALAACIMERLDDIKQQVVLVAPRVPEVVAEQRKKLHEKITELSLSVDETRIEQEVVLLAQRLDITEELDRLTTHLTEVRRVLNKGGTIGRRLDFLMQELNREANTLASKSIDTQMTQAAVEVKVLIEQMREQIQNLE